MYKLVLILCIVFVFPAAASATDYFNKMLNNQNNNRDGVEHNAFGPGIHKDRYGRPFRYQTQPQFNDQNPVLGPVKRHGYGHNVHMDQYGRPVRQKPTY